jgi:triacylglycerol esterase/lipase EstA (alpha/beta hydrolase family)
VKVQSSDSVDHVVQVAFTDTRRGGSTVQQLQGPASTDVSAGTSVTLTYLWDTTGLAWDAGSSLLQPVHALLLTLLTDPGFGTVADSTTQDVTIDPRPIVFVHGLASDATTWLPLETYIARTYPGWQTHAVDTMNTGSLTHPGAVTNTIAQNARDLAAYISLVRETFDTQHIDIVAHSMGGLISRWYIQNDMPSDAVDRKPVVTHLVMLGTPNVGSPCASLLGINELFPAGFQNTPGQVALFNAQVTNQRGVAFSVLAGDARSFTCSSSEDGDDFVSLTSARYVYTDVSIELGLAHTDMTSSIAAFELFEKPHLIAVPGPLSGVNSNAAGVHAGASSAQAAEQQAISAGSAVNPTAASSSPSPEILSLESVTIQVAGSTDIQLPISRPQQIGVLLAAPAAVSAQLIDPAGLVVASTPGSTTSDPDYLYDLGPVALPATGIWTLHLVNNGASVATAFPSAWEVGDPLSLQLQSLQADSTHHVEIAAQLANGANAILGAKVTATVQGITGSAETLTLTGSGNGIYSATTTSLAPDSYEVVVSASGSGFSRTVTGQFTYTRAGVAESGPQPPAGRGGVKQSHGDHPGPRIDGSGPLKSQPAPATPADSTGANSAPTLKTAPVDSALAQWVSNIVIALLGAWLLLLGDPPATLGATMT